MRRLLQRAEPWRNWLKALNMFDHIIANDGFYQLWLGLRVSDSSALMIGLARRRSA